MSLSINQDNWFSQGVSRVIGASPVRSGDPQPNDIENQLEVLQLLCQLDRTLKAGGDTTALLKRLDGLLGDPNIIASLKNASPPMYEFARAGVDAAHSGTFIAYFESPDRISTLGKWFTNSSDAIKAFFGTFPTDSSPYTLQQMEDVKNFALMIVDLESIPSTQFGPGVDSFFKGHEIGINLPNILVGYYYQEYISQNPTADPQSAMDWAVAQVREDFKNFPVPTDPNSNYAHMYNNLQALLANPPSASDFAPYISDYFESVVQQEIAWNS